MSSTKPVIGQCFLIWNPYSDAQAHIWVFFPFKYYKWLQSQMLQHSLIERGPTVYSHFSYCAASCNSDFSVSFDCCGVRCLKQPGWWVCTAALQFWINEMTLIWKWMHDKTRLLKAAVQLDWCVTPKPQTLKELHRHHYHCKCCSSLNEALVARRKDQMLCLIIWWLRAALLCFTKMI